MVRKLRVRMVGVGGAEVAVNYIEDIAALAIKEGGPTSEHTFSHLGSVDHVSTSIIAGQKRSDWIPMTRGCC